jgi:hypothetical protein
MRSSFFRGTIGTGRFVASAPGRVPLIGVPHPRKSRNSGEDFFTGGEPPDSTASPAKPSLTGGAGPITYLSSGQAAEQAGISSLDENYLAIPLI